MITRRFDARASRERGVEVVGDPRRARSRPRARLAGRQERFELAEAAARDPGAEPHGERERRGRGDEPSGTRTPCPEPSRGPARYAASATAVIVHATSTTPRVKMPHDQTRSAFDRNFIAAAISRKPMTTFTRASHGPDRGSWLTSCGAIASATNGSAKVAEYASSPAIGRCHSPWAATTSRVPMNAAVHVSDVMVKVSAISSVPAADVPRRRDMPSSRDIRPTGRRSS